MEIVKVRVARGGILELDLEKVAWVAFDPDAVIETAYGFSNEEKGAFLVSMVGSRCISVADNPFNTTDTREKRLVLMGRSPDDR